MNAKELAELAQNQFDKRSSLLNLWQEIADNFYPERADFTINRSLGTDFGAGSMTSFPFLCRRDLGDQFGTMLRPTAKEWFHMAPVDGIREDTDAKRWLEWAGGLQRRAMYDRATQFTRATKSGDHDYAAFGQCVMSVEMNYSKQALLYRTYHLRDVTWTEGDDGEISCVFRKWKPQVRDLVRLYPKTVHQTAKDLATRDPFAEVNCLHFVVPMDMYTGDLVGGGRNLPRRGEPRVLVCYDTAHDVVLEAIPIWNRHYIVPRWSTPGHTQFAYSPATIAALADARLIQSMTLTLLEAGEKITNPPMIATLEAVRSDVDIAPGGITWIDIEYDERLGAALRPMTTDAKGMPIGIDMQRDSRHMIAQAFYLNKLSLPIRSPEMTAYEVGQRIQQYIRDAIPIFEPMEQEYNGAICEETFEILMRHGAFGDPRNMPRALQGREIIFRFESPLHDAIEQARGQKFLEMKGMIAEAIAMDPSAAYIPDVQKALREAMMGVGIPARWQRTEDEVAQMVAAKQQQATVDALLARMQAGADVAGTLAGAQKDVAAAAAPIA